MKHLFACLFLFPFAIANDFSEGDLSFTGAIGPVANFIRYDGITKETPYLGFAPALGMEYALSPEQSLLGQTHLVFLDQALAFGILLGTKYRYLWEEASLLPFASLGITFDILAPLKAGPLHYNLGLKAGVGLDYFFLDSFYITLETALQPTLALIHGEPYFEMAFIPQIGISWRL